MEANQKRLILSGTILVLAVAAGFFIFYYQGQKEKRASVALSNVRLPSPPTAPIPPGTSDAYLKVAREHAGTKAGGRALLAGAATLFTERKYDEAQRTFQQFLNEYPQSEWVAQAHFGVASTLDAQGKTAEAASKFEEIRRRYANDPILDEVKLALGRLYENQNKPEEAHKIYAELVQNNPYSGMGSEAGMRKEELEAKYPHLKATNAPILTPPALTTPPMAAITNRPTPTNRVITISNVAPRAATNTGTPPSTSNPLLLQPPAAQAPAAQPRPSAPAPNAAPAPAPAPKQ